MTDQSIIGFPGFVKHVIARRRVLRRHFDVVRQFGDIEETCIPSYLHRNPFAAGVSWLRLRAVARLYQKYASAGPVLDFGCGSGELRWLLPPVTNYHFVESNEALAAGLTAESPNAVRQQLDALPDATYAAIFALDSLEHNTGIESIILTLQASLRPGGVLIVSGPTENALYKFGRRIAGFSGEYHETNIFHIETVLQRHFKRIKKSFIPAGVPLFSISAWR